MGSVAHAAFYAYIATLILLSIYGAHRFFILYLFLKHYKRPCKRPAAILNRHELPPVTVQLPIYNELYVAKRIIESAAALDYPKKLLTIQVLDDSTDATQDVAKETARQLQREGYRVQYRHRDERVGFKAGALAEGLGGTTDALVAIFDADFIPPPDFLKRTVPYFQDESIGMVQTRWGWLNRDYSLLTRIQSIILDGHFMLEHTARFFSGRFFNFNGTGGVFRRRAILESGGWQGDTLTEDLDLSYRAQMHGWKFIYLPDIVCPSELPVDIYGFKNQQHRWAKGSIQVGKKLLPKLWKTDLPLRIKLEATFHLSANLCYLLVVLLSLLMPLSLLGRDAVGVRGSFPLEIIIFLLASGSIFVFYSVAQRELYPDWKWRLRDIPLIFATGIGMCLNNAWAVSEALLSKETPFVRTAKYRIESLKDTWKGKIYKGINKRTLLLECVFTLYMLSALILLFISAEWGALPYVMLFVTGFIYIFGLSILHAKR